jgi:peptide/nickel transport system permease protein
MPCAASMIGFLVRRILWGLAVLLGVAVITFWMTVLLPSDPARAIAGVKATPEDVERIRQALGLDRPVVVQFVDYLGRLVRLDLGESTSLRQPVVDLLAQRFPATAQLAVAGVVVGLLIGLPLGIVAAVRRGRVTDRFITVVSALLIAAPIFWVGLMLQYGLAFQPLLATGVEVFPISGYEPFSLRHLFLPALALGIGLAGAYARLVRTALLEELGRDYIRTARAKGLRERVVVARHGLRNAAGPVAAQVGLDLGLLLGGVVILEGIFSWTGIGKLAVDSIGSFDVPLIMGTVLFGTFWIVVANVAVDVVQAVLDPRIRVRAGG